MTPDLTALGKRLVAGDSPPEMAASVVRAVEQLTTHLARIVGAVGIRALLARSVFLVSSRFPWLASTIPATAPAGEPWSSLEAAMARQDPDTARSAFADLLATFAELLGRLIGEGLVARLLTEVWPEVVSHTAKETT